MVLPVVELDRFARGEHRRLWEMLGAQVVADGVRFAVWAPGAASVTVVGDWGSSAQGSPLTRLGDSGVWAGVVGDARVGDRYRYGVTTRDSRYLLKADPMARQAELAPSNASVVAAATGHRWTDHEWMRTRSNAVGSPLRIYEVHLGSWRSDVQNYRQLGTELAEHVGSLGFTHVELLPVAEHPFGGSWGYQVTGYYAPTARYGTPDDLKAMVDTLHAQNIGVIVDWVPAHFPKDEWALARFDGTPLYEDADPQRGEHPDWGTYVFDFGRKEVCNFLAASALYWLTEFHIDGLRVDAVTSMLHLDYSREPGEWTPNRDGGVENLEAIAFVRSLNTWVAEDVAGALMIAEESTAWPKVSHGVAEGGLGFTHKWNLGWMNDTLGYLHRQPADRPLHHRDLTFGLMYAFEERFVLPLSHDEVVHEKCSLLGKMPGTEPERFSNLRALLAWMWALPGAPLLFMGTELAPLTEWVHDGQLPWDLMQQPEHRAVCALITELNRLAVQWPALYERDHEHSGFQWLEADDADRSIYVFLRWGVDGKSAIVCVANFSRRQQSRYRVGVPPMNTWKQLLDTSVVDFDGASQLVETAAEQVPYHGLPTSLLVDLPPLSVLWFGSTQGT